MAITAKQLEARNSVIGSSDAAAILMLDPYRTPYEVWAQKTGRATDTEMSEKADFGTRMEGPLRDWLAEHTKRRVVASTATFKHAKYDFIAANIDAFMDKCVRGNQLAEIKVSGVLDGWGEAGTDQVPERCLVQVQHQCACSDAPGGFVVRCVPDRFRWTPSAYYVPRNDELIGNLLEVLAKFHRDYIVTGTPPPVDPEALAELDVVKRIVRPSAAVVPVDLGLITEYQRAHAEEKKAKEDLEAAKNNILLALGDARLGTAPGFAIRYAEEGAGMKPDMDAFAAAHPDLVEQYNRAIQPFMKKGTRNRLYVTAPKK